MTELKLLNPEHPDADVLGAGEYANLLLILMCKMNIKQVEITVADMEAVTELDLTLGITLVDESCTLCAMTPDEAAAEVASQAITPTDGKIH